MYFRITGCKPVHLETYLSVSRDKYRIPVVKKRLALPKTVHVLVHGSKACHQIRAIAYLSTHEIPVNSHPVFAEMTLRCKPFLNGILQVIFFKT